MNGDGPLTFPGIRAVLVFLLLLTGAGGPDVLGGLDDGFEMEEDAAFPAAQFLLDRVISTFPAVPVGVEAQILAKTPRGRIDSRFNAEILLDWQGSPPVARYTIRDAFGEDLERLEILSPDDPTSRQLNYAKGNPLEEAELPDLYQRIQNTDISWIDLALTYLWWQGGTTVGTEPVKGRFCYIIDLPAPASQAGEYAGVRLWIDARIYILLQAAAYDADGQLVKLLEVKSFKKVKDVWIIQDLDVQSFPVRHKTSLRVRGAEVVEDE